MSSTARIPERFSIFKAWNFPDLILTLCSSACVFWKVDGVSFDQPDNSGTVLPVCVFGQDGAGWDLKATRVHSTGKRCHVGTVLTRFDFFSSFSTHRLKTRCEAQWDHSKNMR